MEQRCRGEYEHSFLNEFQEVRKAWGQSGPLLWRCGAAPVTGVAAQVKFLILPENACSWAVTSTIPGRRGVVKTFHFDLMLQENVCSDLCIAHRYISPGDVPINEGISVVLFYNLCELEVPPNL